MMPPLPPLPPEPHRAFFHSEREYLVARNEYARMKQARRETIKSNEAMLILMAGLYVITLVGGLGAFAYVAFGWRAIAYGIAGAGLMWVAYVQIRRRL